MELGLLIFRLFLAAVFGLAGFAKLVDPAGSRKAVAEFGVPASLAGIVAVALPAVEMVIAVLLLFTVSSWIGAIGAAVLLTLFVLGMIIQLIKGNAPDCHCFGQLHSEPIGVSSVIRNLIFLISAIVIISAGRTDQGMSIVDIDRDSLQLMLLIAMVMLLGIAIDFFRRLLSKQDEILRRIEIIEAVTREGGHVEREHAGHPHDGLPIGAILPEFEIADIDGNPRTTSSLVDEGLPVLLFFVSPTCIPCKSLVPKFEEWAKELSGKVKVALISSGNSRENVQKFGIQICRLLFVGKDREFADAVNAKWTPTALFIDANGKIASHIAAGDSAIVELVDKITAADLAIEFVHFSSPNGDNDHNRVDLGSQIPEFEISTIDGRTVSSNDLVGKPTLVTFWSTSCGHCERMAADLKEWDHSRGLGDPNLLVFSDGEVEPHAEMGLKAPIVLDKGNKLSAKLGMFGTPSAVLIDENGRFASEVAIGAKHIWSLIGKRM